MTPMRTALERLAKAYRKADTKADAALTQAAAAQAAAGQSMAVVTNAEQRAADAARQAQQATEIAERALARAPVPGPKGDSVKGDKGDPGAPGPKGDKGDDGLGFRWRGNFVPGAQYEPNDVVRFKTGKSGRAGAWVFPEGGRGMTPALAGGQIMVEAGEDGRDGGVMFGGSPSRGASTGGGGEGGVTDHGLLTGLGDDDHTQYLNNARGDIRYYTKAEIAALLVGKADAAHGHVIGDVSGLQEALDAKYSATNPPPGGGGATEVYMQPTEPVVPAGTVFVWLQTGLGDGTDFAFFVGEGL